MAVAAGIVASALVLLARAPSDEPSVSTSSDEPLKIAISDTPAPSGREAAPANDEAAAKVRELEAMSGSRISAIGVGPERDEIVQVHDLLD